jgi:hypothetical protein
LASSRSSSRQASLFLSSSISVVDSETILASLSIAGYNSRKASLEVLRGAGGGSAPLLSVFCFFATGVLLCHGCAGALAFCCSCSIKAGLRPSVDRPRRASSSLRVLVDMAAMAECDSIVICWDDAAPPSTRTATDCIKFEPTHLKNNGSNEARARPVSDWNLLVHVHGSLSSGLSNQGLWSRASGPIAARGARSPVRSWGVHFPASVASPGSTFNIECRVSTDSV